ncbi:hypothetical protein [Saliphagus sp. LR7]|uniref:hypothetical protein n=1 Tax=Saliphagus sp. LR7 TaxID=2282654 RepID=UPI000DF83520|nr:hypothetical protein [Saliphagus sp. LR7]
MDDHTVRWRRDPSTSPPIRALWALGAGTFLAAIVLVVFGRFLGLAGGTGTRPVVIAALAALAATIAALAIAGDLGVWLERLEGWLPGVGTSDPEAESGTDTGRAVDAIAGAVVVGSFMVLSVLVVGGSVGNFLAALTLPLALVAVALSTTLRSVGVLDPEEGAIYLYEPEEAIDLATVEAISARYLGEWAIVSLTYAQPDGVYVPGPRRLVVPPRVARDLEGMVGR